jgi:DNA topoisomerase-6 subunit B
MSALALDNSVKDVMKSQPPTPRKSKEAPRATAESMATKQRDISVSEFFAKNRHLLGFDNPRKALLTTVKEAVDNSLDACEEAGMLPSIAVIIEDLQPDRPASAKSSRYRVTVVDNGPGIVRKQVENIFGRLLYGSKFHRLKMSRGQQGIGISAAGMYGLITTGRPMLIQTRPKATSPAHHIELAMNTKTNRAEVTVDEETDDFPLQRLRNLPQVRELVAAEQFLEHAEFPTGTSVTVELEGKYQRGRGSVDEFLELTAIANPHAKIVLVRPTRVTEDEAEPLLKREKTKKAEFGVVPDAKGADGAEGEGGTGDGATAAKKGPIVTEDTGPVALFPRGIETLPPETQEIQPHPKGVELGILLQMLRDFEAAEPTGTLFRFLQEKFSRVSSQTASKFCEKIKVTSRTKVSDIDHKQAETLYQAFMDAELPPPPTDCLAPIGVQQLLKGMFKGVRAEFYAASSREAEVYRGRPFLIEAAIAYGGELPRDESARVIRFANRVPLLYQQSACSSFKAVTETNWRNYELDQPRGGAPGGPLVIMVHMASVWVPFTSESKEAIADYDEIRKEMTLALKECGRKLGAYIKKRAKMKREGQRRDVFRKYLGEIVNAIHTINGADPKKLYDALMEQAKAKTAVADLMLDDEGKKVEDDPAAQEGVLVIEQEDEPVATDGDETGGLATLSKAERAALKVAAMAHDDEPMLMDVKAAAREMIGKRGGATKVTAKAPSKVPVKAAGKSAEKPAAKAITPVKASDPKAGAKPPTVAKQAPAAAPGKPTPDARPAKPKMRLDPKTGKLVPAEDGPGLFGR